MEKHIGYDKLSKKKKRVIDSERRVTWGFIPTTRTTKSAKVYSRKKLSRKFYDDGELFLCPF